MAGGIGLGFTLGLNHLPGKPLLLPRLVSCGLLCYNVLLLIAKVVCTTIYGI